MEDSSDITALLVEWDQGGGKDDSALVEAIYGELRRLAAGYLYRERPDHSLSPTALVHETYLKLIDQRRTRWQNRAHFFAIAAHLMRRILVDHARAHGAAKRGKGDRVPLEEGAGELSPIGVDVLALDLALDQLADSRASSGPHRRAAILRRPHGRGNRRRPERRADYSETRLGTRKGVALPATARRDCMIGPLQWQQIGELFHAARERPVGDRSRVRRRRLWW